MWQFHKSKTVWTAIITGAAGLGLYVTGEMSFVDLIKIESLCLMTTFLRHGIAKAEL